MAEVVGGIRVAIRDLLSTLADTLVSWAIALACTVGAAAPLVVQLRDLFGGFWRALSALKQNQATAPA